MFGVADIVTWGADIVALEDCAVESVDASELRTLPPALQVRIKVRCTARCTVRCTVRCIHLCIIYKRRRLAFKCVLRSGVRVRSYGLGGGSRVITIG